MNGYGSQCLTAPMVLRMIHADHEHGLADYESPGAEEPRHPLREPPERVGVVSGTHLRGAARNR